LQLERQQGRLDSHDPAGYGLENAGVTELMDLFCHRWRHPVTVDVPISLEMTPEAKLFLRW
jgi:hypothetical protein